MENDENIRVTIRTGTSTRRPEIRESDLPPTPIIHFEIYPVIFPEDRVDMNILNFILSRSMQDCELKRDPARHLDIQSRVWKESDQNETCTICKCGLEKTETLCTLKCNHSFHHNCIQEWGKYKPECPLCRATIPVLERR